MDIRIYIGAHKTASQHLDNTLTSNIEQLEEEEVVYFNRPGRAMRHINQAIKNLSNGADKIDVTGEMLHDLTNGRDAKRLLIVNPNIIGDISRAFGKERFYPNGHKPIKELYDIFEHHKLRLFMSIRNPATFLPSCYAEKTMNGSLSSYADFIQNVNIANLKWSSFIHRMQDIYNDVPITVWRFEDYSYIWRDVAQVFAGIHNGQDMLGETKRINHSLSLNGAELLNQYIGRYGVKNKEDLDNIKKIYLERFPSSPNEIIGPNWPPETVVNLTDNYGDDWYYIERMEGVKTIQARQNL